MTASLLPVTLFTFKIREEFESIFSNPAIVGEISRNAIAISSVLKRRASSNSSSSASASACSDILLLLIQSDSHLMIEIHGTQRAYQHLSISEL
jgi:hypothetical protein